MLDTLSSPLADVVTASLAVLPSEPGAPDGQSGISAGVWAASECRGRDERGDERLYRFHEPHLHSSAETDVSRDAMGGNACRMSGADAAMSEYRAFIP